MSISGFQTPTLSYWGFEENPFSDKILEGNLLDLFIDREKELRNIHDALKNILMGITGSYGVGKTSLLKKFENDTQYKTIFIKLTGYSVNSIFIEILSALLILIINKTIKIKPKQKINYKKELDRIDTEISHSTQRSLGLNKLVLYSRTKEQTKSQVMHDETSAISLIKTIIKNLKHPIIIILDDLDTIKLSLSNQTEEYLKFISKIARVIKDNFSSPYISFILSLDKHFMDLIQEAKKGNGYFAFTIDKYIILNNLNPFHFANFIHKRLFFYKWNKKLTDFIDLKAFWVLILASEGHPRLAINMLQSAMQNVAINKGNKKIRDKDILVGAKENDIVINSNHINIILYLLKNGSCSASNPNLQKYVNLSERRLRDNLKNLSEITSLIITMKKVKKRQTNFYSIPEIIYFKK